MSEQEPLQNIAFISLHDQGTRNIGDFELDPDILLPVEMTENWSQNDISWESIISAMLKLLVHDQNVDHADYYRRFILEVKPEIKQEFTEAGIFKARNKDYDMSIEIFQALCGLFPLDVRSRLNLALVYQDRAQAYQRAEKSALTEQFLGLAFAAFREAEGLDPENPDVHFNFAQFYLDQNNHGKARGHFGAYLAFGSDAKKIRTAQKICDEIDSWGSMDTLFKEGFDFINMGRETEGIAKIQAFLDQFPGIWNAWFLLGWGYRRLGDYSQAKKAFLKSLTLNNDHADTLNELAICHMELGELDESVVRLEEALKKDPDNTKVISNMGILALKQGRDREARSYFETVLVKDEEDPIALKYLEQIDQGL